MAVEINTGGTAKVVCRVGVYAFTGLEEIAGIDATNYEFWLSALVLPNNTAAEGELACDILPYNGTTAGVAAINDLSGYIDIGVGSSFEGEFGGFTVQECLAENKPTVCYEVEEAKDELDNISSLELSDAFCQFADNDVPVKMHVVYETEA